MAYGLVDRFDAFQDNPWPILYKELDQRFPSSKFILTLREPAEWIRSQVRHFGRHETPMRTWIYGFGCPEENEDRYLQRFESHNREVLSYFSDRPNDLLVMDLTLNDGWQELCAFLGVDIPGVPFPHVNKAGDRENNTRLFRRLTRLGGRMVRKFSQ
jgi:hypothetical protein